MLLCYMFYYPSMLSQLSHLSLEVVRYTVDWLILPQFQMINITIPKHLSLPLVPMECTFNSHDTCIVAPFAQMD